MIETLDSIKKQLTELATVLNAFKSEAVQLRILEFLIGEQSVVEPNEKPICTRTSKKARARGTTAPIEEGPAAKHRKAASGTGPHATLNQLLAGTFFDKAQTLNDIIEHCKHNLARTFKANEFSGKLGRMVRNGELTRKKNADKQYEYKKP